MPPLGAKVQSQRTNKASLLLTLYVNFFASKHTGIYLLLIRGFGILSRKPCFGEMKQ